jgi:hypothetical protein
VKGGRYPDHVERVDHQESVDANPCTRCGRARGAWCVYVSQVGNRAGLFGHRTQQPHIERIMLLRRQKRAEYDRKVNSVLVAVTPKRSRARTVVGVIREAEAMYDAEETGELIEWLRRHARLLIGDESA